MTTEPLDPNADLTAALRSLVVPLGQLLEQGNAVIPVVAALEVSIKKYRRALWSAIGVGAVLILVLAGVAVDNRAQVAKLRAQFCPVIAANLAGAPPSTPKGHDVERAMNKLAGKFHCPGA